MQKRRIVAGVALAAAAVSLVVCLVAQGLDRADKWGSVISALVALTSLWFVWPKPGPDVKGLLDALKLEPLLPEDPRKIGEYSSYSDFDAHNMYVLLLAECGPLGVIALLWVLWRMLRLALALRRSGDESDSEVKALGMGFTVAVIAMGPKPAR